MSHDAAQKNASLDKLIYMANQIGKAFAREMRIPYPIAFDHGQFAATYGASALPETVFLDRRGRIAAIVHGAMTPGELATDLAKIAPATATPART